MLTRVVSSPDELLLGFDDLFADHISMAGVLVPCWYPIVYYYQQLSAIHRNITKSWKRPVTVTVACREKRQRTFKAPWRAGRSAVVLQIAFST